MNSEYQTPPPPHPDPLLFKYLKYKNNILIDKLKQFCI